ncbi:MAG: ATP-dependent Clp protease ATP-binding subunit ClpA, partial [Dongiaceae bacterium]
QIIAFSDLPPEIVAQVVDKFVMQLEVQLADRHVLIELSDDARKWLAQKGFDPLYGARPLARVIQDNIKKALAEDILFGRLEKGGTVRIDLDRENDKLTFEVVESKSTPREETVEPIDA